MLPNTNATDRDKALIAGHYVFAKPEIHRIKKKAQSRIKNINIDEYLKAKVRDSICDIFEILIVKSYMKKLQQLF